MVLVQPPTYVPKEVVSHEQRRDHQRLTCNGDHLQAVLFNSRLQLDGG